MGMSLEFVKKRIDSGGTNGMENNKYDWMEEYTPYEFLNELSKSAIRLSVLCKQEFECEIKNKGRFKVRIVYNPNADMIILI